MVAMLGCSAYQTARTPSPVPRCSAGRENATQSPGVPWGWGLRSGIYRDRPQRIGVRAWVCLRWRHARRSRQRGERVHASSQFAELPAAHARPDVRAGVDGRRMRVERIQRGDIPGRQRRRWVRRRFRRGRRPGRRTRRARLRLGRRRVRLGQKGRRARASSGVRRRRSTGVVRCRQEHRNRCRRVLGDSVRDNGARRLLSAADGLAY